MFELFIEDYERRGKQKTADTYRKLLSKFEEWCEDRWNLEKFSREDVLDFLRLSDWANATKNVFLSALSSWAAVQLEKVQPPTTDAERKEVRRFKQIMSIRGYENDSEGKDPLTLDNVLDFRTVMNRDTKRILWLLLWFGFRYDEFTSVEEIDYGEKSVTVPTSKRKNHERTLYFDEYTERILEKAENEELFDTPYNTLYKKFRRRGKQARVELTPHVCRHTFATQMGEEVDPFTLAKMLGHTLEAVGASRTTGKYVHPSQEKIKKVMTENHYLQTLEVKKVE